ncbi:OLC1v1012784C1 [Oldenlandia corymbosa var. corymbosa]|uniref:OLC1v1012784C1 n=1 Tax=Oldenlandia corymbosa var. corymbosa TaxID=529605 RepID=A0AAV1DZR7_OLDCO|nr:OLC1v1012784C1 [Oldenlandia corymbosa var. corymbosa]
MEKYVLLQTSLRKQKYLIVMDDIWDVELWCQVQASFPNDKNGSRILFTTRINVLATEAKEKSISHDLCLFSDEKSWQLIEEKLSHYGGCPHELEGIGKQIATYCNGLPVAVSLIANILTRREQKLELWNEVADNLKSHLNTEGCGNVIELSYKYLADLLRQCFLYFGTFKRGREICAKELKSLWIAEAFIDNNGTRSLDLVANEFLSNLISHSLVIVTKRTSMGAIKWCTVHDLLYDLCLEKSLEEKFLLWADHSTIFEEWNSSSQRYIHHRLCIKRIDPFIKPPPAITGRKLPTSQIFRIAVAWVLTGVMITISAVILLIFVDVYNLHDGINPSLRLVSVQLNDVNYLNWSRSVRTLLESKMKFSFVDGTCLMPPLCTFGYMHWKQADSSVKSWLAVGVSLDIIEVLINWKQGDQPLLKYYNGLKKLWDQYEHFRPFPECPPAVSKILIERDNEDKLVQFILGLNDSFQAVKDNIMMIEPLPMVSKAYAIVLQIEKQRNPVLVGPPIIGNSAYSVTPSPVSYAIPGGNSVLLAKAQFGRGKRLRVAMNMQRGSWKKLLSYGSKDKGQKKAFAHLAEVDTSLDYALGGITSSEADIHSRMQKFSNLQQEFTRAIKVKATADSDLASSSQVNFAHFGEFAVSH